MKTEYSPTSLVIILHEIYGINDHIQFYRDAWINEGFDVLTPNLLHRESFTYAEEEKAYQYFMNEIEFNTSLQEVKEIVKNNRDMYEQIYIIGFSIGATIAWLSSECEVDGIIAYYGSRIRNFVEIEPNCPTLLFFSNEKSFDVQDLAMQLRTKEKSVVEIIDAEHGFMNPFYKTYNASECHKCMESSIDFLKQLEERRGI